MTYGEYDHIPENVFYMIGSIASLSSTKGIDQALGKRQVSPAKAGVQNKISNTPPGVRFSTGKL